MPGKKSGEGAWSYMFDPALYISETVLNATGDLTAVEALANEIEMGVCETARDNALHLAVIPVGVGGAVSIEVYADMGVGLGIAFPALGEDRWCLLAAETAISTPSVFSYSEIPAVPIKVLVVGVGAGVCHVTYTRSI